MGMVMDPQAIRAAWAEWDAASAATEAAYAAELANQGGLF